MVKLYQKNTVRKVSFKEGDEVEIIRGDLVSILIQAIPDVPCLF